MGIPVFFKTLIQDYNDICYDQNENICIDNLYFATSHSVPCQDVKVLGLCSSRNAGRVWGRTAVVQNNLNPTWAAEAFTLNLFTVMPSGGKLSPLIIEVG